MFGAGVLLALTAQRVLAGKRPAAASKEEAEKEAAADEDEAENLADAENTGRAVA
jgi:hypothetical protein